MKLDVLMNRINGTIAYTPPDMPDIRGAYTSDLLSDVMANANEGDLLITVQAHINTIAVCSLVGIAAVVFCSGRAVTGDVLAAAQTKNVAVATTDANQFAVSGEIYAMLREG